MEGSGEQPLMADGMNRRKIAEWVARGIAETGIEGTFSSVSCSTAGDEPSLGISQWEGERAGRLLAAIPGGGIFSGISYSRLSGEGRIPALSALLGSAAGRAAQMRMLAEDAASYAEALLAEGFFSSPPCVVYAGMWCPTSVSVVCAFLRNRAHRAQLDSLWPLHRLFRAEYAQAADVMAYEAGYHRRAEVTYRWVSGLFSLGGGEAA